VHSKASKYRFWAQGIFFEVGPYVNKEHFPSLNSGANLLVLHYVNDII